jgi:DNA-binding NarL/FixJ family response regulator
MEALTDPSYCGHIALTSGSFTKGRSRDRFVSLVDSLIAQIDVAFRKVTALPLEDAKTSQVLGDDGLELSSREQEIPGWLCRGKTNLDIAAVLDISPFTVKNHVQRIFRKDRRKQPNPDCSQVQTRHYRS